MSIPIYTTQRDFGGLGSVLPQIGTMLGEALGERRQAQRQQQSRNLIQEALQRASINPQTGEAQELTPMGLMGALSQAISQGATPQDIQSFSQTYKNIVGSQSKGIFAQEDPQQIKNLLLDIGMDEATADAHSRLYSSLSTGGKTSYGNFLIDQIQRGNLSVSPQGEEKATQEVMEVSPGKKEEFFGEEIEFPDINPYGEGLTPKEKAKVQSELFKDNTKIAKENEDKYTGYLSEERSIKQLNTINERGKLPKNLEKLLKVNLKTGDVRISPSLTNPDTQLFIKTINEFVRKARDSFGARVTNFELDKFLQGLPTLANTQEGRRLILEQMDVINKLNQLDASSLKKVYRHYGLRGIDQSQAKEQAENIKGAKQKELEDRFDRVVLKNDILEARPNLPEGHSMVLHQGEIKFVKNEDLEKAKQVGAKVL
jgi:hypothetical protein